MIEYVINFLLELAFVIAFSVVLLACIRKQKIGPTLLFIGDQLRLFQTGRYVIDPIDELAWIDSGCNDLFRFIFFPMLPYTEIGEESRVYNCANGVYKVSVRWTPFMLNDFIEERVEFALEIRGEFNYVIKKRQVPVSLDDIARGFVGVELHVFEYEKCTFRLICRWKHVQWISCSFSTPLVVSGNLPGMLSFFTFISPEIIQGNSSRATALHSLKELFARMHRTDEAHYFPWQSLFHTFRHFDDCSLDWKVDLVHLMLENEYTAKKEIIENDIVREWAFKVLKDIQSQPISVQCDQQLMKTLVNVHEYNPLVFYALYVDSTLGLVPWTLSKYPLEPSLKLILKLSRMSGKLRDRADLTRILLFLKSVQMEDTVGIEDAAIVRIAIVLIEGMLCAIH